MEQGIKVGNIVEETGTGSGFWLVAEVFPSTRTTSNSFARIVCCDNQSCEAFVNLDRLNIANNIR